MCKPGTVFVAPPLYDIVYLTASSQLPTAHPFNERPSLGYDDSAKRGGVEMTQEAYIYEAIRTPRAKGKANGELHEVKPIDLVVTLMDELVHRTDLDTALVDDVVLGCVISPKPPR